MKRDPIKAEAWYPPGWLAILKAKEGKIFVDREEPPFRALVTRGPSCLCAYIGVPEGHPLAGWDYEELTVECHGGLTFSGHGHPVPPKGWWWYGWDYGHAFDCATDYDTEPSFKYRGTLLGGHRWTVPEVEAEIPAVLAQFRRLRVVDKVAQVVELAPEEAEG